MMCQYGWVRALFSFLFLGLKQHAGGSLLRVPLRLPLLPVSTGLQGLGMAFDVGALHTLAAGAVPSCEDADIAEEAVVQVVGDDTASNVPVHAVVPNGRLQAQSSQKLSVFPSNPCILVSLCVHSPVSHSLSCFSMQAADPPLAYAAMELLNAKLLEAQSTMATATTSLGNSDLAEPLRAVKELLAAERGSTVAALQRKAAVEALNSDFYGTYPRLHQRVGVRCGVEATALKAPSCFTCSALHVLKPNPSANETIAAIVSEMRNRHFPKYKDPSASPSQLIAAMAPGLRRRWRAQRRLGHETVIF
ncbi:hypothetical protein C8R45DRAFT_945055 [Mycena sanguinolenta]|nr:hypothetical protein C8R45DRAFT_945055 [Mycena sanguinolenta]